MFFEFLLYDFTWCACMATFTKCYISVIFGGKFNWDHMDFEASKEQSVTINTIHDLK